MSLLLLFKGAGGGGKPQSTVFADLVVQFGWDATPTTPLGSVAWTDTGGQFRAVDIGRGRNLETDDFQAGLCTLVLPNADRTYDPDYTAGTYYGKLLPNRRVRVLSNYNGTNYPLFCGFTPDDWEQTSDPSDNDGTVTLQCVDGFTILQGTPINASAYASAVTDDASFCYFRLGETSGTVAADSSGNGLDGEYINLPAALPSTSALIAYDDNPAMQFNGAGYVLQRGISGGQSAGYVDLWFSTTSTDNMILAARSTSAYGASGGIVQTVAICNGFLGPAGVSSRTPAAYNDGKSHHLVSDMSGAAYSFQVDGVELISDLVFATSPLPLQGGVDTDFCSIGASVDGTYPFTGTIDEVAFYQNVPTNHYATGTAPYDGDSTGTRIGRILDLAGWPTADRNIATGSKTLGPMNLSGSALDLIKTVERSEQGRFFIDASGIATFQDCYVSIGGATSNATSTTSQATFADDSTHMPYFADGFKLKKSVVRNTVTGQRDGGASITLQDATSLADFLVKPWSVGNLANQSDEDVRALLQYQLARYAQPHTISENVTIKPQTSPFGSWTAAQMWAATLGMEISERNTITRTPQNVGSANSFDVLVEGVAHHIVPMLWAVNPSFSTADTRSDWFILGTSAIGTGALGF